MKTKKTVYAFAHPVGSMWGVVFASLTALCVGAGFSAFELILRKVEVVNYASPRDNPLNITFVRGSEDPMPDWEEKIARINSPRHTGSNASLFLFEGDLNVFLKRSITSQPNSKVSVNVRATEKYFQMGILTYPSFIKYPLCLQTRGIFKKNGDQFVFVPRRTYIGSLPLPGFMAQPVIAAILAKTFSSSSAALFVDSWKSLTNISLLPGRLALSWE